MDDFAARAASDDDALAHRYYALVLHICRSRLPTDSDAQDATQETLLRFLQADRSRIAVPAAWLTAVAVRVCARWHRARYQSHELVLDDVDLQRLDGSSDVADVACDHAWLLSVAARLPERDYRLLHWLYLDQLTCEQVGNRLGITPGHVRILSLRARRRAATLIVPLHEGNGLA